MKSLREILYKTLVEQLEVQSSLLSRIEGNKPIGIELVGGEEIFIFPEKNNLQVILEIPIDDNRKISLKASKLVGTLIDNPTVYMNIKDKKMTFASEVSNGPAVETELTEKLSAYNAIIHVLKS